MKLLLLWAMVSGWIIPPERYVKVLPLLSQNGDLIYKINPVNTIVLVWALIHFNWCGKHCRDRHAHRDGEDRVKMKAEIRVVHLSINQRLQAKHQRLGAKCGTDFPSQRTPRWQETECVKIFTSFFWPLEQWARTFLLLEWLLGGGTGWLQPRNQYSHAL